MTVIKISKLVDGKIPAHTVCPFRSTCDRVAFKFPDSKKVYCFCYHQGIEHTVNYTCSVATNYDKSTV